MKEDQLRDQEMQIHDQEELLAKSATKLKKTEFKLRQVEMTKLKDAQRNVKARDKQIVELNRKISMMIQNDQGSSSRMPALGGRSRSIS